MRLVVWSRSARRTRAALLPVLVAAPLLVLLAARPAQAEASEDRARAMLESFVAGWAARHPEEATRLGDHSRDGALPLHAPAAVARDAAWYRAQGESLASVSREVLPPALRVELRMARDRTARETRERTVERLPQRDPGFVLEPLRVALSEPIRGFYSSPCARGTALRARLRAVPEYLRDARLSLTAPSRDAVDHALERVAALLDLCRVTLPDAFATCREARVQADLAQADSMTTAALMEFAEHLRDHLLPAASAEIPLDAAALAARLEEVAGAPVALDSLLVRARAEWSRRPEPAADGARDGAPAGSRRIDADSADVMLETLRLDLVRAGEISADLEDRIQASDRAAPRGENALVTLGPWDSRGARARLELGPRPGAEGGPRDGALAFDPMFSGVGAELALAREGIPGRATFAAAEKRGGSRVRQALGLEAIRDGWARYVETVWLGSRAGTGREPAARWIDRLERERLARTIAELMLRVEGASMEDAARWLERGASLAEADARRAAVEAAAAPRWAASTLAMWKFLELRAEAERLAAGPFDAAAFHAALLQQGAVPTAWVAETVLRAPAIAKGRRR